MSGGTAPEGNGLAPTGIADGGLAVDIDAPRERITGPRVESPPPQPRRGPTPRVVLAIASLGASVAFVDATIVNIAFPNIERSFAGTPISSLSWVLNAYNIVFAAFLVAAGRIADLLGRRRVFILGIEIFTTASLLCALSPSVEALIAFRVLQALGAALIVPAALALVLNAFDAEHRAHGAALLAAVAAAAAGLGPSIGGVLVAASGWRLVFLVNIPIGVAAVLLARRFLVESRAPGRRRMPDLLGAGLFALAIAALVLGVVKGEEWGWGSAQTVASFVVAAVLFAVFAQRSTSHRAPMFELSLLRIRTFSAANAMTIIGAAGFYGYTLANVLFLTNVWHYSVLGAGLALTPGPFVAAAVAGPTSRLVQRIGHRPVLIAGGLVWGGAVLWLAARAGPTPDFFGVWLPGIVMLGVGAGTLFPNLTSAAVGAGPGESFATATGINAVARQVGAAFGVAIVIAIIGSPENLSSVATFDEAWLFGAGCLFAAGLGCALVERLETSRSASLADAARMLWNPDAGALRARPRARARRAIEIGHAPARASRIESPADFLQRVPMFATLDGSMREVLARNTRPVRVEAGAWLFRKGDQGDAMYIVRAGRLEAVDESSGTVIRELGRGDALGELALLSAGTRSASVRAVRTSDLLEVGRDDFERQLRESPGLSLALNRILAGQLRESRAPASAARPRPATVTLVAFDDRVPANELAGRLARALGAHLSAGLLDGSEIQPHGDGATPTSVYGPLLDRVEGERDLVVLAGGDGLSDDPWTEFCLQQADRIVALTAGGPIPARVSERAELQGCDLLGYGVESQSGALAGWAQALAATETHIVREGAIGEDVARMARRLSGTSIGIVLSGGGARAFAHIGVLEELTAAGIAIDRVAGVSMGAFVGALFAMGLDSDEIDARCFEEWIQRRPLNDYTLPRRSLIRGRRAEAMLRRTFGEWAIEELPRSFECGWTELRSGELKVARWGPLWETVGFSMCVPVLAPAQVRGREIYIDGSLVDNLPVEPMARLGEGPVIAVDVKASFETEADDRSKRESRRRAPGSPSIGETLTRVLLLGSANTSEAARKHADLVIKPRTGGIGLLEFHQIDAAREAGRAAARETLEAGVPGLVR